jgi:hypothetical protein
MGRDFCRYLLQCVTLVWLSFGPSGGNIGLRHSHVRSVSVVTRHSLSPTQPFVTRLGSALP